MSCTKEESKIDNQTRIKNDIPEELIGKWKIISANGVRQYADGEEGCDEIRYYKGFDDDEGKGSFSTITCDSSSGVDYFYIFDAKEQDIVLIAENNGEGFSDYKYQKVE